MTAGSVLNRSRRGDINSDNPMTPGSRRRIFVDGQGRVTRDDTHSDAPTFSNRDPNTSDAEANSGQDFTKFIWGTNIEMSAALSSLREFHRNFTKKYRMWLDGATDEEVNESPDAERKECMEMMRTMLHLGTTSFYLDLRNLKAYPPTRKVYQQIIDFPAEMIPICDQSIKDMMFEIAETEMSSQRASHTNTHASTRSRMASSEPPLPSSDRGETEPLTPRGDDNQPTDYVAEVSHLNYKVRPFNLEQAVNMRELNPSGAYHDELQAKQELIHHRRRPDCSYQRTRDSNIANHSRHDECLFQV